MNTRKGFRIMGRSLLALAVLSMALLPLNLMARGNAEVDRPYGLLLEEEFNGILERVEEGSMSLVQAMERIQELRRENAREDGEEYREMEQILAMVMERTMTAVQARQRFYELEESQEGLTALQQRQREQTLEQLRTRQQEPGTASDGGNAVRQPSNPAAANPGTGTGAQAGTATDQENPPAQGRN